MGAFGLFWAYLLRASVIGVVCGCRSLVHTAPWPNPVVLKSALASGVVSPPTVVRLVTYSERKPAPVTFLRMSGWLNQKHTLGFVGNTPTTDIFHFSRAAPLHTAVLVVQTISAIAHNVVLS